MTGNDRASASGDWNHDAGAVPTIVQYSLMESENGVFVLPSLIISLRLVSSTILLQNIFFRRQRRRHHEKSPLIFEKKPQVIRETSRKKRNTVYLRCPNVGCKFTQMHYMQALQNQSSSCLIMSSVVILLHHISRRSASSYQTSAKTERGSDFLLKMTVVKKYLEQSKPARKMSRQIGRRRDRKILVQPQPRPAVRVD